MFQFKNLIIYITLSLFSTVWADWCPSSLGIYYCSAGQSCGDYYGDCRGLPTYVVISIISSSLLLLLLCIRCCIYINATSNAQPMPRRVRRAVRNPRVTRGQPNPYGNNLSTQAPTVTPLHIICEEPPPPYAVATAPSAELPKY